MVGRIRPIGQGPIGVGPIGPSPGTDAAGLDVVSTDVLELPVDCVLAGQQKIKDRWREYEWHAPDYAYKGHGARFGTSRLSRDKPSFSVTSSSKGY